MFSKIQKSLLLRHPLLWNIRIVPLALGMVAVNLLFFIAGFASGDIDFTNEQEFYFIDMVPFLATLSGIVVGFLTLVVWLVFYFRNNSFKAFYPRGRYSLFKEVALLLLGCWLICLMPVSFAYGGNCRARSYYSEEEVDRRQEIMRRASFFYDGPFQDRAIRVYDSTRQIWTVTQVKTFQFRDRTYSVHSLMNKDISTAELGRSRYVSYLNVTSSPDNLAREKMREWLYEERRDSILKLFRDYLAIADEHGAAYSVTPETWLEKVYRAPDFYPFTTVGKMARYEYYPYQADDVVDTAAVTIVTPGRPADIDTLTQQIREVDGQKWVYNTYYVPARALDSAYNEIKTNYLDRYEVFDWMLLAFYVAAAFSMLVFSFRVTSGRDFLIALVATGILAITETVIAFSFGLDLVFKIMALLTLLAFDLYFFVVPARTGQKKRSGIALNVLLWQLPGLLVLVYATAVDMTMEMTGYYRATVEERETSFQLLDQLDASDTYRLVCYLNAAAVLLLLLWLSPIIRRWKGVPEE